jgi:hypothetical protein
MKNSNNTIVKKELENLFSNELTRISSFGSTLVYFNYSDGSEEDCEYIDVDSLDDIEEYLIYKKYNYILEFDEEIEDEWVINIVTS